MSEPRDPSVYELPFEELQARITADTGEAALQTGARIASLFRSLYGSPLGSESQVLDFGCGWGRVSRYFLDTTLTGIDVDAEAIEFCRSTLPAHFETCDTFPPAPSDDASFDLVYAYSVFSHLSEEAHLAWLDEFKRILKPGGILILTTLARRAIDHVPDAGDHRWRHTASEGFSPRDVWLARYDRGEYCFTALPDTPQFGFAAIPEPYVRERWPFALSSFSHPDPTLAPVIVCHRP